MTVGRNDPCPCGSGKKYKKCCGVNTDPKRNDADGIAQALSLLQSGRAEEALGICRSILRDQPRHPGALELAGMILYEARNFSGARPYLEQLAAFNPTDATAQANLAQVLGDLGDPGAAEAGARRALSFDSRHAGAHNLLGNLLVARENWKEAVAHYRQAVAGEPTRTIYHHNLGHALQKLGKEEAEASYLKAIELEPQFAPAYVNLGGLLAGQHRYEEARRYLRQAVDLDPENVDAYNNLGLANRKLGDLTEAYGAYRVALEKNPNVAGVWHNLGLLNEEGNHRHEALDCYRKAVELDPGLIAAKRDWLFLLIWKGVLDTAHEVARAELSELREPAVILPVILDVLGRSGDFEGRRRAIEIFRELVRSGEYSPVSFTSLLMQLQYPDEFNEKENLQYHANWGKAVETLIRPKQFNSWSKRAEASPLRIGYLSPDFRHHSVGYFIQHVIGCHDPGRFEVYCYGNQRTDDEITRKIRSAAAHYAEVRDLSDEQLARRIHDDGIHILVDLAGHSAETRINVLAHRPAPVQCTWIGYLNTTGLSTVDYRITDPYADDPDSVQGTEQLLKLPEAFLCIGTMPDVPVTDKPACARNGHFTFASFNNISKLNASVIRVWAQILMKLPDSRMVIMASGAESAVVRRNLLAEFARHGIRPDRLLLRNQVPRDQYLQAHNDIDVVLDTFPFNGGTITAGALWMGVPVVTLVGQAHRQRVGYSMLKNIGVEETIAWNEAEYVEKAVVLANNHSRLADLRQRIARNMRASILCDAPRFTRQLEAAYLQAWREKRQIDPSYLSP